MKIERPETAIDARIPPSSELVANILNVVPGSMTVDVPSSLRK